MSAIQFPPLSTTKVTLKVPTVSFDGQMITEVTFREPTGRDIAACGYPLRVMGETDTFNEVAMSKMIQYCGNLSPLAAENMCLADWTACAMGIASFLGRAEGTSSTGSLTPPISGGPPSTSIST